MRVKRRRIPKALVVMGVGLGAVCLLIAPVASTRQGVNFQVSQHRIPPYVKAIDFLHRHYAYQRLAREITEGKTTDDARVLAVFNWTREHIQPMPKGWPVIDDHILNIIIRGYGLGDQMADVFTTLSTYAGVPAFWKDLRASDTPGVLVLSFAKIDGQWVIVDVADGLIFRMPDGSLADAAALVENPPVLKTVVQARTRSGIEYWRYLETMRPFSVPNTLRAQQQMPGPRLWFELRRALHLAGAYDQTRWALHAR
ncbi:MAG: transglutaminase domain-containing protein [Candidatus Omnitrophica bacterium]|nr:transglutaminase domain-containing protein [Candidatus Omnitrophota bacterium]